MTFLQAMQAINGRAHNLRILDEYGAVMPGIEAIGFVGKMFPGEYEELISLLETNAITPETYFHGMSALIDEYRVRRGQIRAERIIEGKYAG